MELEALRTLLIDIPATSEETPFGPQALVYKVSGKMYALIAWQESPLRITLKCDPLDALALREEFPAIQPGYHMNKRHWNTITLNGTLDQKLVDEMIRDSYALVVRGLPKSKRDELAEL